MTYTFSKKSLEILKKVHKDLQLVCHKAIQITTIDFGITEGIRLLGRQKILVQEKKSLTLKSQHLKGMAVDVVAYVDNKPTWEWKYYKIISEHMLEAAQQCNIPLIWGGHWESIQDGTHFELDRKAYQ